MVLVFILFFKKRNDQQIIPFLMEKNSYRTSKMSFLFFFFTFFL
uniref:Uncharacterized protein n=1 Tax=Chlorella vulgaris TaxID=3077 RepID=V9H180_CHLVU|nr:hypothetical protein ChvulCp115 [Chlorella vulgaris]pir/T07302/ hypothetical protein 43b - Chlorella vulgaris chloroplast [Chlorella vulgaris]BAA57950.1 unnamed protein product [Chlorella vulgaris]